MKNRLTNFAYDEGAQWSDPSMKNYNIDELAGAIRRHPAPIVLFGAGRYGKLAHFACLQLGLPATVFCDSDPRKHGTMFCGLEVISPEALAALGPNCHVFISCNYIAPVVFAVNALNFPNLYNCNDLFRATDFTDSDLDMSKAQIGVLVERHRAAAGIMDAPTDERVVIRGMDIMVTEACSMKCKDCSNLMQYYTAPKNGDPDVLLAAFDKMAQSVDHFLEVRLLGGEPFLNKRIHEIVDRLVAYPNVEKIAIFTNATIVPKNQNLTSLIHPKVYLDITHYGVLSRNHDKLIEALDANGIAYNTHVPQTWTDSAKIVYKERTEAQLTEMFARCCVNDVLTLLNGTLYRCPFSANAMNLEAVPRVASDFINLLDESKDIAATRAGIRDLYTARNYISTCSYCNGRDFSVATVEAGVQTKTVLPLPQRFAPEIA
jgi:organic radical activating enzyme